MDTSAVLGNEYHYRVIAKNESGVSEPSNEEGPVKVNSLKIIDEMADESKISIKEGILEFINFKDIYKAKEDNSRLSMDSSSSIIYLAPENILSFKVYAFVNNPDGVKILNSESLENFTPVTTRLETFPPYKNVYGFFNPTIFTCEEFSANTRYIKILSEDAVQLCRVEIEYTGIIDQQNKVVNK
jgi:hypothetical protein